MSKALWDHWICGFGFFKQSVSDDGGDNDYKGGPFDLSALGQRQLDDKKPKFAASPWVPSKNNATKNKYSYEVPKRVITIYSSSEGEDEYKEDPVNAWALQQHRAGKKDPKFLSSSITERRSMMKKGLWPLDGASRKPESSSWPPCPSRQKNSYDPWGQNFCNATHAEDGRMFYGATIRTHHRQPRQIIMITSGTLL